MTEFVKENFPNSTIIEFVDDGINETCYFKSGEESSGVKRYVGKKFSANLINTEDYLAVSKVAQNHVENGYYLNVPVICQFGVSDDDAYVIYEYVEGDQLNFSSVYNKGGMDYYVDIVGKMLAELHNQNSPVDKFGWFTLEDGSVVLKNGYSDSLGLSLSQIDYSFEEISDSVLGSEYRDRIRNVFKDHIHYNSNPSICHCDVKYNNLIDSGDGIHLIDWEFIRSADPLYDLVKTERQFIGRFSQDDNLTDSEYEKYRSILHDSYFQLSDTDFERDRYVSYWIKEMVECLSSCEDWYSKDSLPDVRSYYLSRIDDCMKKLES